MRVRWHSQHVWYLTVVNSAPQVARRQLLWDDLFEVCSDVVDDWEIISDFNSTLSPNEKVGGNDNHGHKDMSAFRNILHEGNLIDMGF